MTDVPAQELQNDVSAVLRRVEAGERLRVTVSGRPVAELVPVVRRPRSIGWDDLMKDAQRWQADLGLASDLATLLADSGNDTRLP